MCRGYHLADQLNSVLSTDTPRSCVTRICFMPLCFNAPYPCIPFLNLYYQYVIFHLMLFGWFISVCLSLFGGGGDCLFSLTFTATCFFLEQHNQGIKKGRGVHTVYNLFIHLAYRFLEAGARTLNQLVDLFSWDMI